MSQCVGVGVVVEMKRKREESLKCEEWTYFFSPKIEIYFTKEISSRNEMANVIFILPKEKKKKQNISKNKKQKLAKQQAKTKKQNKQAKQTSKTNLNEQSLKSPRVRHGSLNI